jgi:hypothetical protein
VSTYASRYKTNLSESIAIYDKYAIGHHVSHIENLTIARDADVLGHAFGGEI